MPIAEVDNQNKATKRQSSHGAVRVRVTHTGLSIPCRRRARWRPRQRVAVRAKSVADADHEALDTSSTCFHFIQLDVTYASMCFKWERSRRGTLKGSARYVRSATFGPPTNSGRYLADLFCVHF